MIRTVARALLFVGLTASAFAQKRVPPYDLWTPQVLERIKDRSTLNLSISPHVGYADVFYTSNPSASWFDDLPPYGEHTDEPIRIHGFLASPPAGSGPFPAVVLGHGHHGAADRDLTLAVASLGYVALFIDAPQAGQSTGGPRDEDQAWISVDKGPQYGFLFHYAYAGMRALTLLEELAAQPGNPLRIDTSKFVVLGASMGGIFSTYLNGIDDRVKAAVLISSAGNWQHTLRYPNSWLYHGIYAHTRDLPYNGNDPLNSIENVDTDPTTITFLNYFDPIRYAPTQHGPVLTVVGTHDEYFPLPNANLMEQAIASAGTQGNFEKRLWMLPNARHGLDFSVGSIAAIAGGLQAWVDFALGRRNKPLGTPRINLSSNGSGLRFDITTADAPGRLSDVIQAKLYVATRIDSTVTNIQDFQTYDATRETNGFSVQIPAGQTGSSGVTLTADNVIYYATLTDSGGLPVSSLVYKGNLPMDLSTDFMPSIEQFPNDSIVAPAPPPLADVARSLVSSIPVPDEHAYQGMALSIVPNTTGPVAARVEAWTSDGRLAAAEGLINPIFMSLPTGTQQIFLAEEWFGPGARRLNGSFRIAYSGRNADSLQFRGNVAPSQLDAIGPLSVSSTPLFVSLVPEQDPDAARRLRIISGSDSAADVTVVFRNKFGADLETQQTRVSGNGTLDLPVNPVSGFSEKAFAEVRSVAPITVRMEVSSASDPWAIDAQPAPAASKLVQPHTEWNGIFSTRLILTNTSDQNRTVTFQLHAPSGTPAAPNVVQLMQKNSVATFTVESLFGIQSDAARGVGWIEIDTGGQVLVNALAVDARSGAAAAAPVQAAGGGIWSMPFFVENAGFFTGLALANPGDTPVTVNITAYDPAGRVLGQVPAVLGAKQNRAQLVSQWIAGLPADSTGQIVITAGGEISLLAYLGTDDGASLAAIPFTPVLQ